MAKAKPAGRSAGKKKRSKSGNYKRGRKSGTVAGRPIIIKSGPLPGEEEQANTAYSVLVESEVLADFTNHPGTAYPYRNSYPDNLVPEIITLEIRVDEEELIEIKVEGSTWSISLATE